MEADITDYELIRQNYLPDPVKVLFVGESRPANGHFFYLADSPLVKFTRNAFSQVWPETPAPLNSFLNFFKQHGCYLDDLCLDPVNKLRNQERNTIRAAGVCGLADRMRSYQPLAIISIMRAIVPFVEGALIVAELRNKPFFALPFPSQGHQGRYVEQLTEILGRLGEDGCC